MTTLEIVMVVVGSYFMIGSFWFGRFYQMLYLVGKSDGLKGSPPIWITLSLWAFYMICWPIISNEFTSVDVDVRRKE